MGAHPKGSEGVCGWLADGYHYPKTLGGQPKSISMLACLLLHRTGEEANVIDGRYPPTEVRMVQCGPASSVANPHVCPGPLLGRLSGGNWMARGHRWRLRPRGRSGQGVGLRLDLRPMNYPDHLIPSGVGCD